MTKDTDNIIDIFTKKTISLTEPTEDYYSRKKVCNKNILADGDCFCDYCNDIKDISDLLVLYSQTIMKERSDLTSRNFYNGDWLEIITLAAASVQLHIQYPEDDDI